MSEFQIGDRVILENAFSDGLDGSNILFSKFMTPLIGKTGTIKHLCAMHKNFYEVCVDELDEGSGYVWHASSLRLLYTPMPKLTTGMRVKTRNGSTWIYIDDLNRFFSTAGFLRGEKFNRINGKRFEQGNSDYDIVKVYKGTDTSYFLNPDELGSLIWQYTDEQEIKRKQRLKEIENQIASLQEERSSILI